MSDGEETIQAIPPEREPEEAILAIPPEREPVCLISRVDTRIRAADRSGYAPERVAIGPVHEEPSHSMKQEKMNRLCRALSIPDHQQAEHERFRPYVEEMLPHVERALRHYYMSFSDMNPYDFAFMLLLDGYFVLSHLGLVRTEAGWETTTPRVSLDYDRDVIFLFENQVPFFILKEIYKLLDPGTDSSRNPNDSIVLQTITEHIKTFVHRTHYVHQSVSLNMDDGDPDHLVHLLYMYFQPASLGQDQNTQDQDTNDGPLPRWRAATYYYGAGVRFAKRQLDSNAARSILDFKLRNGTLQVPCLVIQNNTLTILRNMVALEQSNPRIGSRVACYCLFMAHVANTEEDVRLLSSKKIIVNYLSSDRDVAENFADLCRGVNISANSPEFKYQKQIMKDLEKLCQSRWGKSMAWLRHNKCNNVLMTVAVVAGIIIFLCTVEQSVITALGYAMKRS